MLQRVLPVALPQGLTLSARPAARKKLVGYALISPAVFLLGLLILYPLADAVYLSLTTVSFISPVPRFTGLSNYGEILHSSVFWQVVRNSMLWTVLVVLFQFLVGMGTALLLARRIVGRALLRALVIVPWVMPGIIGAIVWRLMYEPLLGLVNRILTGLHLIDQPIAWLAKPSTVLGALIFAAIWKGTPFSTLMYMAAYQNVRADLIEAAKVDGANAFQRLFSVVLPAMAPTIRTTILLTTVWTFNYFDLIWVATRGGPGNSSHIFPTYIYQLAFANSQYGLGAAYGMISLLVLSVFTVLYVRQVSKAGAFEA